MVFTILFMSETFVVAAEDPANNPSDAFLPSLSIRFSESPSIASRNTLLGMGNHSFNAEKDDISSDTSRVLVPFATLILDP